MAALIKHARIYMRVSTDQQDLTRQQALKEQAERDGCYVAGVYAEKASGTSTDRPELQRMINDLQQGDVVVAEKMDRISRLPLPEAEKLIQQIKDKGATLCIPGVVDLSDACKEADDMTRIVMEGMQTMLLRMALQMARDDYETRRVRQAEGIAKAKAAGKFKGSVKDLEAHKLVIELRTEGKSIAKTAKLAGVSLTTVKSVWKAHKATQTQTA